ncbi:MAG: Flagellar basal-body rod protein FlgG [Deltaproteobacteria bacterium ADurb.Bin510]|nr:MAG: Flagellar basal-body rod protein FlgG [Deltaproteobacteria bacterium ADurb.Bin510]
MIRSMWTAAAGMTAQELRIDVMANNLANVSTNGFKKSRAEFEDVFYQTLKTAGAATPTGGSTPAGIQVGLGVRPTAVKKIFSEGDITQTKNELDMAIEGSGFFQVQAGDQIVYTRDGSFQKDSTGLVVNARGDVLQPPITVPDGTVTINIDKYGAVSFLSGDTPQTTLGTAQINIYTFTNEAGLKAVGSNYYIPTEGSGDPIEGTPGNGNFGSIAQGYIEASNVNALEELVTMIAGQRAYELNSRTIRTADSMLQTVSTIKS